MSWRMGVPEDVLAHFILHTRSRHRASPRDGPLVACLALVSTRESSVTLSCGVQAMMSLSHFLYLHPLLRMGPRRVRASFRQLKVVYNDGTHDVVVVL